MKAKVYLICSAMRALVFCTHVLRERGVSTRLWILTCWSSVKLSRKNTKVFLFPLCLTLVKMERMPFRLQAQLLWMSSQHKFLFIVIYRLAVAWILGALLSFSCTFQYIFANKKNPQNIYYSSFMVCTVKIFIVVCVSVKLCEAVEESCKF